jgi:hypothetical protein
LMGVSVWTESIGTIPKFRLPNRLHNLRHLQLHYSIFEARYT